ncbi:hypothetical protein C6357_31045 [Bacillus wiedmannii]|uniref:Uncharacterized protein n=1 Tax=Bacillus wiedmannii TaxID=1890302 RepID=A0ABX5DJH6_9BACI|nr:hypothetical protein C6357_31045 [Bacillus wiedmannii]
MRNLKSPGENLHFFVLGRYKILKLMNVNFSNFNFYLCLFKCLRITPQCHGPGIPQAKKQFDIESPIACL